ncbi:MAG TPA: phosphocholine cytidylyltransferase family protein, partial [Polyangiaceae bacterium]|nr:phosphocholine cytidylyltransferase family protein [Polyangiaceae bacterium]
TGMVSEKGMRPVIIGAGRGSRLEHLTEEIPKTLVPVMGRPMLEWVLEALSAGGFSKKDVVFICGYRAEVIKARYPEFTYVENRDWEHNNILLSLMCAREHLGDGFVSTYADIVYRGEVVRDLVQSPHDKALGCDTDWRRRYVGRTRHPETDAEKLEAEGDRITRISRTIASEAAAGEFIGVTKFTARGAGDLTYAFDRARELYAGKMFREKRTFERAYLIDLFQRMIEEGSVFHRVDTHGGYMEIDTLQDQILASSWWSR